MDDGALPCRLKGTVPHSEALRRAGRWLGWLAVALSLGFVARQLWIATPWQLVVERSWPLTAAIAAGALAYGGASLLLSTAWRQLLTRGPPICPAHCYHAIYGRTQIAKYLPGNVFHFAGRQILGRRLGHSQTDLATASLLETGELVLVAALMALPLAWPWLAAPSWWWSLGAAAAAMIGSVVAPDDERSGVPATWSPCFRPRCSTARSSRSAA